MDPAHQPSPKPYNPAQAVEYGQLIQIAYNMYDNGNGGLTPKPPTPFFNGYTFIAWVQMRDFIIEEGDWTFYGFIAHRASTTNEFVLAIRGTGDDIEWWDDLTSMVLVPLTGFGQVGYGFNRIYQTLRVVKYSPAPAVQAQARSLQTTGTFAEQVAATVREYAARGARPDQMNPEAAESAMSVEVAGHSLGGALATLYVAENTTTANMKTPVICTFASPRVGDPTFARTFNELGITSWRIVNEPDLVPKLPFLGFHHVNVEHTYNSGNSVDWSLACWHSLSTYLHLIDPTQPLSDSCKWPPKLAAATESLRQRPTATPQGQAEKEISVAVPRDRAVAVDIKISIR